MPSRISDALKDHPVCVPHKILDLGSVKVLPDSYAWNAPPLAYDWTSSDSSVPVVDLGDPGASVLIGRACKDGGVFQITNHGVPRELLTEVEWAGMDLFSLPLQQKMRAARKPDGVSGYGVARISSFFPKLMWSEGFTIVGSPIEHARRLWPRDRAAEFCDVIGRYEEEMKRLAGKLMWLMLEALGIRHHSEDDVTWAGPSGDFPGASAALQMNSYPACPDPDQAMGLAAHTDSTLLTILLQNDTAGLQVMKRDGSGWVTIPPIDGALVVNVGDLLHILTNGTYPSVVHRVFVTRNAHRRSIAYLYGPPSGIKIAPLPVLTGPGRPPLYRPVTWGEYLGMKAKHFDKALTSVRLPAPRASDMEGLTPDVNIETKS
ncbi:hypothetical protein MLD38_007961 [Melastoma candidum]|uniref:Uncharacterized protein n=1 Tax=Melastoma candidum TaxID=119954 RepID=A0ACB9RRZ3_9MYRT|nr:hypothetical protein MLD38_007961 [Melastoma candidum]